MWTNSNWTIEINFIFFLLRVNLWILEDHDIHLENKF